MTSIIYDHNSLVVYRRSMSPPKCGRWKIEPTVSACAQHMLLVSARQCVWSQPPTSVDPPGALELFGQRLTLCVLK
jgi:hypothetical protein